MLAEQPSFLFFALEHPKDLLASIVGLALVIYLLYRFALPAFKSGLNSRAVNIENVIKQADAQLEDIARLRNDYFNRIQQIEQEQRERIAAAVNDADNARAEIVADAEEAARAIRRRGDEELARERTRQRILLRQQMVALTLGAAETAIRAQNNDTVQRHLIRDFVGMVSNTDANPDTFYVATPQPAVASATAHTGGDATATVTPVTPEASTPDFTASVPDFTSFNDSNIDSKITEGGA